mmetsp:Transcript_50846/g.91397  ORF Transcript_50846/g.91397 Transcript_50846/m.91397 type:complete len:327 (+) Transcript_50846:1076-2056(+)
MKAVSLSTRPMKTMVWSSALPEDCSGPASALTSRSKPSCSLTPCQIPCLELCCLASRSCFWMDFAASTTRQAAESRTGLSLEIISEAASASRFIRWLGHAPLTATPVPKSAYVSYSCLADRKASTPLLMRRRKTPSSCTSRSQRSACPCNASRAPSHQFSSCSSSARGPLKCQSQTALAMTAGTEAARWSTESGDTSSSKKSESLRMSPAMPSRTPLAGAHTAGRCWDSTCQASLVAPIFIFRRARLAILASCWPTLTSKGSTSKSHLSSRSSKTREIVSLASSASASVGLLAGRTCWRIRSATGPRRTRCTRPLTFQPSPPSDKL